MTPGTKGKDMAAGRIRMRHLSCFRAVARLGSVTAAAKALGTVQPAVSRSIRELEDEVGAPLFDRSSTGLVPNEQGRVLLSYVVNGLGQIDRGLEAVRGRIVGDRVVAYVLPNVVRMIMPGAMARFKTHYPDIDVTLVPTVGGGLQTLLNKAEIDFGFGRLLAAEQMKGLSFEHLFSETLDFFVRTGHPLAAAKDLSIDDIDAFPVVLPAPETIIRTEVDRFVISQGLGRFRNVIETISFEFARNFMMISDAVVCQPFGALRRELTAGQAVRLDFARGAMNGAVGITVPAARPLSAPAQLLVQMIRDEVVGQGLD